MASLPEDRLPTHPDARAEIDRNWQESWGDRRQEIVFIGAGLDPKAITAALNAALVNSADYAPTSWEHSPDPFPVWGRKAA